MDKLVHVDEGATPVLPLSFTKPDGTPVAPGAASFVVTDIASQQVLVEATAFHPASDQYSLVVPALGTQILDPASRYEDREVAVSITVDGDLVGVGRYNFRVRPVLGVSVPSA